MIRNAVEEDGKVLSSLIVRGWKNAYIGLVDDIFLNNMDEEDGIGHWQEMIKSQDEKSKICVYEENGRVLGVIKFGIPQDTERRKI